MKRIQLLWVVLFTFLALPSFALEMANLNGIVTDASTNMPLAGATVYISDLKATTTTDSKGEFAFKNIPAKGNFLMEVRYIGYKTASKLIDLSSNTPIHFELQPTIIESAEVVITGTPNSANSKTNSLAVVTVNKERLTQAAGTNLIDAIAKVPGISQVTTGGAISKPSIRGLGYNRVLTMVDGAREESQQWGDEHGVEVDQFSAARVEILKGPASLLYGSDALGGVINIIDDFVAPIGQFDGNFTSTYNTNNGLTASSLMLQGNTEGFVYRGRVSYKNAFGFGYKDKVVPNSGFNETNFSTMLGLNKTWGYAHLTLSKFGTNIGLVEEGPDLEGNYHDANGDVITNSTARTRKIGLPFQDINHYRATLNSNVLLGGGQLKTTFAFQKNIRKEFEESEDEPGLFLTLDSYTYDAKYSFGNSGMWEPTIGVQGMYQVNSNSGEEYLIPDYKSNNIGFFAYLKRSLGRGAVNGGIRYDHKSIDGEALFESGAAVFSEFKNSFSNISGSLGFSFELAKNLLIRGNAGSGFRAPNIAELAANGKHEGTFRYEKGNNALKQETSLQFDLGLTYDAEKVTVGLNAYNNRIYDYIYLNNQNGETIPYSENGDITILPVYRFVQTDANLWGGEASVDFHLIKSLHFENAFSYVKGTNLATGSPLPFIPATAITNEIRFEPSINGLSNAFIKFGLTNTLSQKRFDLFETETDGYTLIDAGVGAAVKVKNGKINLWITGQNLANKLYFSHQSRYKPVGIYNTGRNISFGISLPL